MQGCIVPPNRTFILFLSFQRIPSIWNQFRPVLQGELLEQVRIPTALPAVPFVQPFKGLILCVHVQTVIPLYPPVKRGVLHERRSVLFAFALPSVRGTTAYYLTICRGTFPHLPTVRPFKPSGLPVTIEYHVSPWLNIYFCYKRMDKTRNNSRIL